MTNKCSTRGVRYDNDEDKIEGKKAYSKYSAIYWTCDVCPNTTVRNGNKSRHMKSITHQQNVKLMKLIDNSD